MIAIARCAVRTPQRGFPTNNASEEKGSTPLARIPSVWAESAPSPRSLYLAVWRNETNSLAQRVFPFSPLGEFREQSDLGRERPRHPVRAFSLTEKQIGRLILPQPVPQRLAFRPE